MKYMITGYRSQEFYDRMAGKPSSGPAMSPEEVEAMGAHMADIHQDLVDSGEYVDAQALTGPAHARRVTVKAGSPVVTDGPYPETAEVLAGYTIVDCDSFDRATEIAATLLDLDADGEYADVRPVWTSILEGAEDLGG